MDNSRRQVHQASPGAVFNEGPTVSQHVDSASDAEFHSSTFKLKRTRSMGLFDNFISKPNDKFVTSNTRTKLNLPPSTSAQNPLFSDSSSDDSMSSVDTKVSLIPKHKLRQQRVAAAAAAATASAQAQAHSPVLAQGVNGGTVTPALLHDDIELNDVKNAPREHVDYLTHKWDVDEISKSWKYVVLRRSAVADSIRLENASWRTWAQTKNNLKMLPADQLNWDNRDNEITWLYGPVLRQNESLSSFNSPRLNHSTSSSVEKLTLADNSETEAHLKSILKKKTMSERVISDSSYSKLQNLLNMRESKLKSLSPVLEPTTKASTCTLQPIKSSLKNASSATFAPISNSTRKIHFNPRVVQCMAVDYSEDESTEGEFDTQEEDDSMDEDTDDDLVILNRPKNISHKPITNSKNVQTIVQLPATTLNLGSDEKEVRPTFKTNKGLNHYDYNSVYKSDALADIEMVDVPEGLRLGPDEQLDQMDVDSFQPVSTFEHLEDQSMSDSSSDDGNENDSNSAFQFGSLKSSSISVGLSGLDLSRRSPASFGSLASYNSPSSMASLGPSSSNLPPRPTGSGFLLNSSDSEDDEPSHTSQGLLRTQPQPSRGGFDLNVAANSCTNGSSLADVNRKFISSSARSASQLSRMSSFSAGPEEESDDSQEDEMWFGRKP